MRNKKILITGASGFIGRGLVNELCKENFVYAGVHKNKADFRSKNVLEVNFDLLGDINLPDDIEIVFHLAGILDVGNVKDNKTLFETNVIGTLKLLEHFKDKRLKKFVLMSSSAVYGDSLIPNKEDFVLKPFNLY